MRHKYRITMRTRDIFNFTVAVMVKQYDTSPEVLKIYDSADGQLIDLVLTLTTKERMVIGVALDDYILRINKIDENGKDVNFADWMVKGWL